MRAKSPADLELGERIWHLRTEILGCRQQDFADKLDVTRGAVGNWELGKGVKRATLQRISETFNISFLWLTTGNGSPFVKPGIDAQLNYCRRKSTKRSMSIFSR